MKKSNRTTGASPTSGPKNLEVLELIGPTQLAAIMGVSRQRVSFMLRNIEQGDNRRRVNDALRKISEMIQAGI